MRIHHRTLAAAVVFSLLSSGFANALGPTNLLVIVNRSDPESLAIANEYRIRRGIPDENFLYLDLDFRQNGNKINFGQFQRLIQKPALDHIKKQQLEGIISTWVTTRNMPHAVGRNSISGAVFFNEDQRTVKSPQLGPAGFERSNEYFHGLRAFFPPLPGKPPRFLHMMLDAGSLSATKEMIVRSAGADGTDPKGVVYLCDGTKPRDSRKITIPPAMRYLRALGISAVHRAGTHATGAVSNVLGIYTGIHVFAVQSVRFVPGALADHLTSLGGSIHDPKKQMLSSDWLAAGCSATYGTVFEPFNYPQKFPTAMLYVYYGMGFSAVESYWMSVQWPQEGLFLGDPLTRPFGKIPQVRFSNWTPNQEISGTVDLEVQATAAKDGAGISQIDIYVDGRPAGVVGQLKIPVGIQATLRLGGESIHYETKEGDTLTDIVLGLKARFAKKLPGIDVQAAAASIFLTDPGEKLNIPEIEIEVSSPLLSIKSFGSAATASTSLPVDVTWHFAGQASAGDRVTLEIIEGGKSVATMTYAAALPTPASKFGLLVTSEFRGHLPTGYRIAGIPPKPNSDLGGIRLIAEPDALARNVQVRLRARQQEDSLLEVTHDDVLLPLVDRGGKSSDFVWLQFGFGQPAIQQKVSFPSAMLADGLHRIRAVAHEGSAMQTEGFAEIPIRVRNGASRMIVKVTKEKISAAEGTTEVASVTLENVEKPGPVKFLVNGQDAGTVADAPFALNVDPSRWGVGIHRITANTMLDGGKELRADNEIHFEITP